MTFVTFVFFVFFVFPAVASSQPRVTGTVSNITRVESWSFFQPREPYIDPASGQVVEPGEPDYTFVGDRAELGVRVEGQSFDLAGTFNYVRLENLPTAAIGPGALGEGAFYYAATGLSFSYQLYLSELSLRWKRADRRLSLTAGRMPFRRLEGAAVSHSGGLAAADGAALPNNGDAPNLHLAQLMEQRLDGRLIGNFESSYYQRRFDGARVDVNGDSWHASAGVFAPTQGGYEESANLTMPQMQVAAGAVTHVRPRTELQAFVYLYRDRRDGDTAVVDNTFSAARAVDITVASIGGSHAAVRTTPAGELDTLVWGALQLGDWYGQSHRGAALALELGHRWTGPAWAPWLRGGFSWASGDGDADDGRHRTFFQMLPSSRKFALSSTYTHMNLRDLFVQALVEPRGVRARIEVHRLSLASGRDLWYYGSGATSSSDRYFGYSGRGGASESDLGTVLEGTIDVPIVKHWSVNAYLGVMWGGAVVDQLFTDKRFALWTLENVIRF